MTAAVGGATSATSNSVLSSYLANQTQAQLSSASTSSSSNLNAAQQTAETAAATSTTFGNFNTFLNILTTQLQNQDPTNATDPNQFTQELVQFAGVEQQLSTNSKLDTLINYAKNSSGATAALSYIGQYAQVTTTGNQVPLQGGSAEVGYTLASASSSANVFIKDSSGNTVATLAGAATQGTNYVTWNGENSAGTQLPDGAYTFSVAVTNADGTTQTPSALAVVGKVTGVTTNTDGTSNLTLGTLSLSDSNVDAVYSTGNLPVGSNATTTSTTGS